MTTCGKKVVAEKILRIGVKEMTVFDVISGEELFSVSGYKVHE